MSTAEKFTQFLASNGWLEKFVANAEENWLDILPRGELLERLLLEGCEHKFVSGAFDWGKTAEGVEFWWNVDQNWLDVLRTQRPKR